MRKFILFLIKLIVLVLLIISPFIHLYHTNLTNSLQEIRRKNYAGQEILILGSSHGRDGFYDGIIDNSHNLSSSGFTLEETFKEIIRLDKTIPRVIMISFSPFSLNTANSKPRKSNVVFDFKSELGENPILSFFNNPSRKEYIRFSNKNQKTQYFKKQLSEKVIKIKSINEFKSHTLSKEKFGLKFFYKINDYCKNNNIRLIYIVTPFSTYYNNLLDCNRTWKEDLKFMNKSNINYEFYDYSKFFDLEIQNTNHFIDGSHLNSKGGYLFTTYLKEKLF